MVSIPGDGGEVEGTTGAAGGAVTLGTAGLTAGPAGVEDPGEAGPVMVLDPASVGHPFSHLNPVFRYPFHFITPYQRRLCLKLLFFTFPFGSIFPRNSKLSKFFFFFFTNLY